MKLCLVLLFAVALNAVNIKYVPTPDSRITVIPGSSEEFERTLGAYADAATVLSLKPVRPYSVIVTNNSTTNVIAVVIFLELAKPDGSTITHDMALGDKDTLLAPGESALVAPNSGLSIRLRDLASRPKGGGGSPMLRTERIGQYEAMNQVTVSIDSIAFADGSVVGPDKIHYIERSNKKREGERMVLVGAAERSPQERLAYLTEIVNTPEPEFMSVKDIDYFYRAKHSTAQWLLELQTGQAQMFLDHSNPAGITAEQLIKSSIEHGLSHQMPILFKETK